MRSLVRSPLALARYIAVMWLALVAILMVVPERFAVMSPQIMQLDQTLQPPRWLGGFSVTWGSDAFGRDLHSRLIYGARHTFGGALLAAALAVGIGTLLGVMARLITVIHTVILALLAIPSLLWALLWLTWPSGFAASERLALAIGMSQAPAFAYTLVEALWVAHGAPHLLGAQAIGASRWRQLWQHELPIAADIVLPYSLTLVSYALLSWATLSFLGLGLPVGTPDWGVMAGEGRLYVREAFWLSLWPTLLLLMTTLALHISAQWWRASLYPRG
jgi:peptide/nickel transport system permease protein